MRIHIALLCLLLPIAIADDGKPEIEWRRPSGEVTDASLAKFFAENKDAERVSIGSTSKLTDAGLAGIVQLTELKWLSLTLSDKGLTAAGMKVLSKLPALERISFGGTTLTAAHLQALAGSKVSELNAYNIKGTPKDAMIRAMAKLPLTQLSIRFNYRSPRNERSVTDAQLEIIAGMKTLQKLNLQVKNVSAAGFQPLAKLTGLRELGLAWSEQLDDETLRKILASNRKLTSLSLHVAERITDDAVRDIDKNTELRKFRLTCSQMTDGALGRLSKMKLTSLNLYRTGITDAGMAIIARMETLEELGLSSCKQVTAKGLAKLKTLQRLRHLDLGSCKQVDDDALSSLVHLKQLELLRLSWTSVVGLAPLFACKKLKTVDLTGTRTVTDAALVVLGQLPALIDLDVGYCPKLTPKGFAALAASPACKDLELMLAGEYVTDAHLEALHGAEGLKKISCSYCKKVSKGAVAALREALPGTKID